MPIPQSGKPWETRLPPCEVWRSTIRDGDIARRQPVSPDRLESASEATFRKTRMKDVPLVRECRTIDLGRIAYGEAAVLQQRLVAARKNGAAPDLLLFCEHPHVITLGRSGKPEHLRVSEDLLHLKGVEFHHTNRGGDITYHGPGQIMGYPVLDLNGIRRDVVWYVRQLEETMIRATSSFGIHAFRVPGRTGVWVEGNAGGDAGWAREEKLAAIGVH